MLQPGLVVGGIRIDALLGRGAMGEVYRGQQLSLKRPVAVKRIAEHLLGDADAIGRFAREAQCVARIQSPYVVAVHDFMRVADGQGNDHALLVMELVDGGASLRALLAARGQAFDWRTASALILHAAEGLAAAAEHGVVHRDIKPDNLMVTRKGVAKLADFGLAKSADSSAMTMEGTVMGTPLYLPPEACRGQQVDARGDLYSLGATWFHLLTGRPPFEAASTVALLRAHLDDTPPEVRELVPAVPVAIAALVHRLLAKAPDQRLPSAQALVDELHALASQGIVLPRTVPEVFGTDAATTVTRLAGQADPPSASMYVGAQPASATATLPMSPTAATVLAATTMPMTPAPGAGGAPAAALVPPATSAPTSSPTPVAAPARKRNSPLFLIIPAIALLIAVWVFGGKDHARVGIRQALAAKDTGLALQRAATNLAANPSDAEAVALVREVVHAEIHALIAAERIDDARKRIAEHRAAFTWLDSGALDTEVAIAGAKWLATHHREKQAVEQFAKLRNDGADPVAIDRAMVDGLADSDRPAEAIGAAWRLAEASTGPLEPRIQQLLVYGLKWEGPYGESVENLRKLLLARHPGVVDEVRPWLDGSDFEQRYNAFFLLLAAGRLSDAEIVRFHAQSLMTLRTTDGAATDSLDWLRAEAAKPDWTQRRATAQLKAPAEVPPLLKNLDAKAEATVAVLASALLPMVEEPAVTWIADEDESVRWNAFRLLTVGDRLARIDVGAFHARTLTLVNPLYESPAFTAALAHFGAKAGTPAAPAAKAALDAGLAHIRATIADFEKAGGNFMQMRANTCKERLKQVQDVLAKF